MSPLTTGGTLVANWLSSLFARKTICKYCLHDEEHHGVGDKQCARLEEGWRLFARVLLRSEEGRVVDGAPLEEITAWMDNALEWERP